MAFLKPTNKVNQGKDFIVTLLDNQFKAGKFDGDFEIPVLQDNEEHILVLKEGGVKLMESFSQGETWKINFDTNGDHWWNVEKVTDKQTTDTQTNGAKSPVNGGFTPGVRDKSTNASIETQVKWKEIAPIMSVALQAGIDITEPLPEGFLNNINSIYLALQNADLPF